MKQEHATMSDLPQSLWDQLQGEKLLPWIATGLFAPIDVLSLSDKLMLHELTHARREPAPGKIDYGTIDIGTLPWAGYGEQTI